MGYNVNPNNDGFKEALNDKIYVDKSEMLLVTNELLDTKRKFMCVSRPRRFGKSMAVDLLIAYYSKGCNSKELFANSKIVCNPDFEKHLNKYNVIWLNLPKFSGRGGDNRNILTNLNARVIRELKKVFPDMVLTDDYFPAALEEIYAETNEKFIILIDEWDLIFRENKNDSNLQKEFVDFYRSLFKDSPYIKLAYLTGILPVKRYNTQSALNNFDEYTMINPMGLDKCFGFTEDEVIQLCDKWNMSFDKIKSWYDGYLMPNNVHLYNPRSVVTAFYAKNLRGYWVETASYESLKIPINMNFEGLKETVIELMAGNKCRINVNSFQNDMVSFNSKDDALTLLIHLGYLGYDSSTKEVFIPNKEIKGEFENTLINSNWKEVTRALKNSEDLLKATLNCDEEKVAQYIEQAHQDVASILQYNSEETLKCVVYIAYYTAISDYSLIKEFPTGKGFADLVLLPYKFSDKPLIIVELKHNKTAESALEQIKAKKYTDSLKDYSGEMILVGINYDDDKKHSCKIEKLVK